ncbi:porin [Tardiphaga sp.]|uniref:porin n=1 Tax=Tardiphaga sp. TaxID=1926292 RepID=UPI00262059CE|nr:porin [Tardiphaga sp.]MDB5620074.1 Porin [Tardiphaga sp.]
MNTIRTLALTSVAALISGTVVHAANLPVKAKAVEYVKACSLYGAGFYFIPGTDTCIKIGGSVRLDTTFNGGVYNAPYWQGGAGGNDLWTKDYFYSRSRINLSEDTRTATEYGVLRTFANVQMQWSQNVDSSGSSGYLGVDYAFIQFAGFTIGKAVSQFDPQWTLSRPTISSGMNQGSNDATGIQQIAYTATFGNGLSASVSVENAYAFRNAGVYNTANYLVGPGAGSFLTANYGVSSNTFLGNATGGDHIPDVVANVRLDQAWGSLHFATAFHNSTTGFYGSNESTGHPEDSLGYAFSGAAEFKNLPTGTNDSFKIEAAYGKGAAKYVFGGTTDTSGGGRYAKFDGSTLGFGYILDGVFGAGTGVQQSTAWEVSAYYEHYWDNKWRTSLFGNYSHISYGAAGDALLFSAFNSGRLGYSTSTGSATAGTLNANGSFDLGLVQIGTRTAWTPVQNLTLSAEFSYSHLGQDLNGTYTSTASGVTSKAAQTYQLKDQNLYNGSVQILRSF